MRVILKPGMLILSVESDAEREAFEQWRTAAAGHVFSFEGGGSKGGALHDLGSHDDACRAPINVVFDQCDPRWRPISNLADTPFTLHGRSYASIEGFWQGLRFDDDDDDDRRRVAALSGAEAKFASASVPRRPSFVYEDVSYPVGGHGHRQLMRQACKAKFTQDFGAREALLASGERPLTHRVRRDSETIPGALMADIWMRLRARLSTGPVRR